MSSLPQITVAYAWDTGASHGPIHATRDDAIEQKLTEPASLTRLYIHPDGRIVHTENADEETAT